MELDLRRLRILREVADHGGVTAAAQALRYSPSGVSQHMAALEVEVGARVLERSGRGVRLTEVGRVLLAHSEILLDAEQEACAAVELARDTLAVELRVGVFCTVAAGLIPAIAADLARRHPQVRVTTRETDPDEASEELRHGHLDLAFMIDYPNASEPQHHGIAVVPLGSETLHVAAPAGVLAPGEVSLDDLPSYDWIISGFHNHYGRAIRAACEQAGFTPRITHQVDEQPTALAMVAAGLGISVVSNLGMSFMPSTGVSLHPLAQTMTRNVLLGHQESTSARPVVAAFISSARRAASSAGLSAPQQA